jgi:uncharacterized protein YqgC (DUF456 family)
MSHTISLSIAIALLIPGIFMAFVPMLPALSYMFVVAVVYGLYDHFLHLTGWNVAILLGITLLSVIVDHTAGLLGAKYGGAHTKSILWGFAGAIGGTFAVPAVGSFFGLFLGVLLAEIYYKRHEQALKAATGALLGSVAGVVVNVILSVLFMVFFVILVLS